MLEWLWNMVLLAWGIYMLRVVIPKEWARLSENNVPGGGA
jgi:hypothetical protein